MIIIRIHSLMTHLKIETRKNNNVNVDGISRQSLTDTESQIIPTVRLTTTAGAQEAPT